MVMGRVPAQALGLARPLAQPLVMVPKQVLATAMVQAQASALAPEQASALALALAPAPPEPAHPLAQVSARVAYSVAAGGDVCMKNWRSYDRQFFI